jgi:protein DEK
MEMIPENVFSTVAFKLSRRKADDTFKLLHTILFGRRGKVIRLLFNFLFALAMILSFSPFPCV